LLLRYCLLNPNLVEIRYFCTFLFGNCIISYEETAGMFLVHSVALMVELYICNYVVCEEQPLIIQSEVFQHCSTSGTLGHSLVCSTSGTCALWNAQ